MLLKQKTNKLFYGKWPYKITCFIAGAHLIRTYGARSLNNPAYLRSRNFDTKELIKFVETFKELLQDLNIKRRIDHSHIDFYLLTKEEFDKIRKELRKYVVSVTEPADEKQLNTLLENKKYILCDQLPHKTYRYKITFKEMPVKASTDLVDWALRYNGNEIRIPKSTLNHFKGIKYHYGAHYFYVKDSKMITLISLASGGYVRRTDEYVVRNSINTESNQESLCQP